MIYDVTYFINKFEKIPERLWATGWGRLGKDIATCATGHCGFDNNRYTIATYENLALKELFKDVRINMFYLWSTEVTEVEETDPRFSWKVVRINDGSVKEYQQPTPKQRILAALYDIKKMQQPTYTDITKDLAVLPVDKIETDLPVKELNHV